MMVPLGEESEIESVWLFGILGSCFNGGLGIFISHRRKSEKVELVKI